MSDVTPGTDPSTIGAELWKIYEAHGRKLSPETVLDTAKSQFHPLHSHFEWDDAVAGEKYRLGQARELIRKVKFRYVDHFEDSDLTLSLDGRIRAYVAIPGKEPGSNYRHITDVVDDPISMKVMLKQMERDWKSLQIRYGRYQEFWSIVQAGLDQEEALI